MSDIGALGGGWSYDTWIDTSQHIRAYADDHAEVQRVTAYLTEILGYVVVGGPCERGGRLEVDLIIPRGVVADSRRGDSVSFEGRWTLKEAKEAEE